MQIATQQTPSIQCPAKHLRRLTPPWRSPTLPLKAYRSSPSRRRNSFGDASLRLRRRIRVVAGWLVALAYLVCIASPGAALALGNGPAPCLTDEIAPVGIAAMPDESGPMMHVHADGSSHDHGMQHAHHHAAAADDAAGDNQASPHQAAHHHKSSTLPGPCCTMMCVSALPADLPTMPAPAQPVSRCVLAADRGAPDNAPPLLYRPPIT
jgi:hypothetical protein